METYVKRILEIPKLSAHGAKQLIKDIGMLVGPEFLGPTPLHVNPNFITFSKKCTFLHCKLSSSFFVLRGQLGEDEK